VESLLGDIRIQQHADMNYASAIMKAGKWMFLDVLDGGRVGFLVMMPKSPIIWMDDKGKHSYILPMRVQTKVCEKGSIAIASLNKSECIVRIEDMKILGGEDIRGLSFTKRWERLLDFYKNSYVYDVNLQRDLLIKPAVYKPIDSIETWIENPDFIYAQNDTMPRRLRIQLKETVGLDLSKNLLANVPRDLKPVLPAPPPPRPPISSVRPHAPLSNAVRPHAPLSNAVRPQNPLSNAVRPQNPLSNAVRPQAPLSNAVRPPRQDKPVLTTPVRPQVKILTKPKSTTIAVPSEEFPDTYTVIVNGEKKGYAAVQDIELSRILRNKAKDTKEIPVKVEWNEEFSSYEILSLL
jgi:hypothetical protein